MSVRDDLMVNQNTDEEAAKILAAIEENNVDVEGISVQMEDLLMASLAAIQCCGLVGTTFTLTNDNTGAVKTYTLSESDDVGDKNYRE